MRFNSNYRMLFLFIILQEFILIALISVTHAQTGLCEYPGTYSFENEAGFTGTQISFIDYTSATVSVSSSFEDHKTVIGSSGTGTWQYNEHTFTVAHSTGTIEFWAAVTNNDKRKGIMISDGSGGSDQIQIEFYNDGSIRYKDDVTWHYIQAYSINTWYHFKVTFDGSTDWHLWINQVSKDGGSGYGYVGNPTNFDRMSFNQQDSYSGKIYLDAIGFSWDTNYDIGDNLQSESCEALPLAFDTWILILIIGGIGNALIILAGVIYYKKNN